MKTKFKRLMIMLLICAMAISVSAVYVSADDSSGTYSLSSYIWIGNVKLENGEYLKSGESSATSIMQTDNYAHYADGILTLKNFTYSGEGSFNIDGLGCCYAIYSNSDLAVKTVGTNVIELQNSTEEEYADALSYGITANGNLEISSTSDASLTISGANGDAINVYGNINIDNVNLTLSSMENGLSSEGDITILDSAVTVNSEKDGIVCTDLSVGDGTVDVTAGGIGIKASGDITVGSGKLVSRTTGTEENSNYAAIGNTLNSLAYDTSTHTIVVSNDASGMPTEQYTPSKLGTYRYVLVIKKELAPKPSYNVYFDVNGLGVEPPKQSIVLGGKISKPTDPVVESYQFVAWYKDAACTEVWNFDNDTVSGTVTLYAKWIETAASHTHYFGTDWHYDSSNHWIECTCSQKSNVSSHNLYEGKCVACGYESGNSTEDGNFNKIIIIVAAGGGILLIGGVITIIKVKGGKKKTPKSTPQNLPTHTPNPTPEPASNEASKGESVSENKQKD